MTEPHDEDDLKGSRILVVDDVPKNIQVLGSALRNEGYEIIPATSGAQGLQSAAAHAPELILLDVMMPEMNGYETLEKLRVLPGCADIPVIFVTALSDQADEEKGLALGAVDYITKPINIPITLARVATHLRLARARQRLTEQNAQLIEAAELREDVDRIARHDLKTPLQVIISAPELLKMTGTFDEKQLKMLGMIKNAGYRMLEMINFSLDMFKMETGAYTLNPVDVDLVVLMRRIREELDSLLRYKQLQWVLTRDGAEADEEKPFAVQGEELLCYSMFANLIKNAIEASPEAETISISLSSTAPASVAIHNLGCVPVAIRERFFDKYATSGKERGTGLGTYSARLIAETQGGSIAMQTDETTGTTITVTFE